MKKNKKITIIDHVGQKAGMDCYSASLAKGLMENNIKAFICSNFNGLHNDKIIYKQYYEGHNKSNNKLLKLFKFSIASIKSSYFAWKQKSDLVILHLFSADIVTLLLILIPKLFGLKIAVISHDISSFANNDDKLIQNIIYNTLSNFIIVHNQFSKNELLTCINIKQKEKIVVIKHGGYLDYINKPISKEQARKDLGLEKDFKYILFFGQIKNVKGLDILIKSMELIPEDIKLIIAGKPWKDDFSYYSQLIKKYNLENRVILKIRFIEDSEREKLFYAADVNVLPYRKIYQSGVLLMAMSYGIPIIASDLKANKEVITDNENGILFESENYNSLSDKIIHLFKEKEYSVKFSKNAIKTIIDDYNWNNISKEYIALLNNKKDINL